MCTSMSPSRERRSTNNPFVRELTKNYVGIDPVHEPIPVRPVSLHDGGIDTTTDAATSLPACTRRRVRLRQHHGANRLGSNSLVEILVYAPARTQRSPMGPRTPDSSVASLEKQADTEQTRIAHDFINKYDGQESLARLRTDLQHSMETAVALPHRRNAARDRREGGGPEGALRAREAGHHSLSSTPNSRLPWSCNSCSRSPRRLLIRH